ncbi:MAG: nitroreductase family protein [Desulfovibrio sp.]|nr:nitroreductase family protein [Desulfovibrio sp.]
MEFSDVIKQRYSVRRYSERPVEETKLEAVLEAGRLAPTACNNQPQKIYVLKSGESLAKIRSCIKYAFNAPIVLLVCVNEDDAWKNSREPGYSSGEMDAAIVTTHMMLAAANEGLGSLWVRGYTTTDVLRVFPLPLGERLVCILLLGYPAETSAPSSHHLKRKLLDTMVTTL